MTIHSITQVLGQVQSPGSSPEHWTTRTFLTAILTLVIVAIIARGFWNALIAVVRDRVGIRVLIYFSEAAAAVALSVLASYFDIFKKSTYVPTADYQPDWHVIFWANVWALVAGYYCVVKLCSIATKELEDFKSKELGRELGMERAAKDLLTRQRDLLAQITSLTRELINAKMLRLVQLGRERPVTLRRLVDHLNPNVQIQVTMKVIHEFFKRRDTRVRLALWIKDENNPDRLSPAFAWDGISDNCFSMRSAERMAIAAPHGTISEIAKAYHFLPREIKIIQSCPKAETVGTFQYFYPEQREKVGSMVLYKHLFGPPDAQLAGVLLLVSSAADHFKSEDETETKQFLEEMLTRVQLEWMVLDVCKDLNQ